MTDMGSKRKLSAPFMYFVFQQFNVGTADLATWYTMEQYSERDKHLNSALCHKQTSKDCSATVEVVLTEQIS